MSNTDSFSDMEDAILEGDIGELTALIEAGGDVNEVYDDKEEPYTLLTQAENEDNPEMIELLLKSGADINLLTKCCLMVDGDDALRSALHMNKLFSAKALISKINDINYQGVEGEDSESNRTALMYAVSDSDGHTDIVELLIKAGADVNRQDISKCTALMLTVTGYETKNEIVKLLLDAGAELNMQDRTGKTALMYACQYENNNIIKSLVDAGADKSIKDNNGDTALYYAEIEENEFAINMLKK